MLMSLEKPEMFRASPRSVWSCVLGPHAWAKDSQHELGMGKVIIGAAKRSSRTERTSLCIKTTGGGHQPPLDTPPPGGPLRVLKDAGAFHIPRDSTI